MKRVLFLFITIFFISALSAQNKEVSGNVTDFETGEPIPFANVYVKNTTVGTTTGLSGEFSFIVNSDSLTASAIGYHAQTFSVKSSNLDINIKLVPNVIEISTIDVKPSDERVRAILKKMVENKPLNNPERYSRYNYEKYSKWDYILNNVEKNLMKSRVFKNHKHLFQKAEDGSMYLPVYFSEQLVYNEFQRDPLKEKSTILADKTSGLGVLDSYEFAGYTSGLEVSQNYYDNYINLYEQNFVSPLANSGWFYYRYYLVDSVMVNDTKQYRIDFYPKRKGENVFVGYMMVDDDRYAVHKLEANLSGGNQLNFIKSLQVECEYQIIDDTIVFYKNNLIKAKFDYLPGNSDSTKQRLELLFSEYSSFDDVEINPDEKIELATKGLNYESIKEDGYKKLDSNAWRKLRHIELSDDDIEKYSIIDSINQIKTVKLANDLAQMGLNGFFDAGKFEVGPYTDFVQSNEIEGLRLYFGGRTSSEISENWMFYGGLAYGTDNELLTGHGGIGYKLKGSNRKVFKLEYDDRFIRMGENRKILYLYENMLSPSETNLVSSTFARDRFDELYRQQGIHFSYENEWRTGLSSTYMLDYKKQFSPEFYPFFYNGNPLNTIKAYEAGINVRLSWRETLIDDGFMRFYVSTEYPIINLSANVGKVEYADVNNWYAKLHATLKARHFLGQTYFDYAFELGKVFGKLPYTMLEIPRGNETYGYYRYDFNLINYLEFIHDQYVHAYMEYHLNGFFINRLPLIKKLGLREVVSAKGMIGSLSKEQQEGISMPLGSQSVEGAYVEIGAGLENIFRFFRVEGVWRVRPTSIQGVPDFGVRVKFEIKL